MNHFTFSGKSVPVANYVACRHTPARTHLTGFDTLAEARQYITRQEINRAGSSRLTLAIVQTDTDQVVHYQRWSRPRPMARLLSFFL